MQGELAGVDRRIDHGGLTPVTFVDAPADEVRVGDEFIDPAGGALVPHAHVMQQHARELGLDAALQTGFVQVLVLQIPGVADGRMHVADMQLVGAGQHALGDRMTAGNDQIIGRHVQLLDGQRHQWQVLLVVGARLRQLLDEGGGGAFAAEVDAVFIGKKIDDGEQISVRPDGAQAGEHTLGAGVRHQPIVNDGNFHGMTSLIEKEAASRETGTKDVVSGYAGVPVASGRVDRSAACRRGSVADRAVGGRAGRCRVSATGRVRQR